MPPHHLHAIRNGVDTHRFCPLPPTEKAALRRRLNLSVDGVIAIFTGRLVHEKRLHHLLSVWSAVRAACPNAALLLIGEGAEEAALRNLSSEGVHFLGSRSDVTPYLQSADVFVLPSAAEGLSISMLEAMSTGLAPVVTRVGGAEEVITNEINGLLIPPDNLPKLQAALIRLLSDEPLRHAIGRAARERMEQACSVEMSVERLFQLYSMLAAAR
jgi:glycosyltransferase involved in cell wall biosynthesis